MKSNLNRRLEAMEETLPDPRETWKARMHARARMIVEDREACDLAANLFESAVVGGLAGEVEDLEARVRILEAARVQG